MTGVPQNPMLKLEVKKFLFKPRVSLGTQIYAYVYLVTHTYIRERVLATVARNFSYGNDVVQSQPHIRS